jgi:glycosyltransferase involved in cell wall biosynthesis
VRNDIKQTIWRVPDTHLITLYNAIDVVRTEPRILSKNSAHNYFKWDWSDEDFIFGSIGRLAPAKDHITLLDAFAHIKPYCPRAKLILIGEGELKETLLQKIQHLKLLDSVLLTGFIPDAYQYLRALDVFILNSVKEAFGRVLLEAMIAKIPIIGAKTHGIPEVLGGSGILIHAANIIELANKMRQLYQMEKEALHSFTQPGYDRACTLFSITHFKEIFWQLPLLCNEGPA